MEELFEVIKHQQKEKLELAEDLLVRLEKLKKERKVVSFLCEAISERTKKIDLLQMQLDQEVKKKLELYGKGTGEELSQTSTYGQGPESGGGVHK